MEKRMTNAPQNDLVLRAIRIAEHAHRNRSQGPHYRKAPKGKDRRPYYFVHLAEVAWMLSDAGRSHELVAAGFLHDIIEDCQYTGDQLEEEIGNKRVRDLVEWVTEVDRVGPDGKKPPWEVRNKNYLENIKKAPVEALTLSCADKTSNIREMCYWIEKGYRTEDFTSRDHKTQLRKFETLDEVFLGKVVGVVYDRFTRSLDVFSRGL
jgi:(p)ppGpp synthase/HD superfamily hydrolase